MKDIMMNTRSKLVNTILFLGLSKNRVSSVEWDLKCFDK